VSVGRRLLVAVVVLGCTSSNVPVTATAVPVRAAVVRRDSVARDSSSVRPAPRGAASTVIGAPAPARAPSARVRDAGDATIRVLLSTSTRPLTIASPTGFVLSDRDGSFIARTTRGAAWRIERRGGAVRAIPPDGVATRWTPGGLIAQPIGDAFLSLAGKPYRGTLRLSAADSGIAVINVVKIDDYLRGVVPLEIGTTARRDSAAVQAQAIAARSYAYIHLDPTQAYDLTGGVADQVYGGVAVETSVASEAVESTRTLVLEYAGRVVNAPYSSTCGGQTASASELWRTDDEPYLQSVSDRIPGTDRYYCDIAPRFHWTRSFSAATLNAAMARYLARYAKVPGGRVGAVRDLSVASRTESGRVATLHIGTDRGNFILRGNDIRYVLRPPGGEMLNSTSFTIEEAAGPDGALQTLRLIGLGYGHAVGMCQWGAIGRARAGQDVRTILSTYYPGTTVGPAP
jgi:stage II sporulation protein D